MEEKDYYTEAERPYIEIKKENQKILQTILYVSGAILLGYTLYKLSESMNKNSSNNKSKK